MAADSAKLLKIFEANQHETSLPGSSGDANAGALRRDVSPPSDDSVVDIGKLLSNGHFKTLSEAHKAWVGRRTVMNHTVMSAPFLLGGRYSGQKKLSRVQLFDDGLGRPYNFFFDSISPTEYLRAPFHDIHEFLSLPAAQFGTFAMWQPFPATVQCHTFFDDSTPFSFDIVAHHVDTSDVLEECSIVIKEIGDLWSLRDYEDRMIDRRPCQLRAWIARLETGSPLGDGTYWEVDVAY